MLMAEYCRPSLCGVVKINLLEQEVETMNLEYCSIVWKNSTKKINLLLQTGYNSEDSTKNYLISELLYCERKNNPKHCKKEEEEEKEEEEKKINLSLLYRHGAYYMYHFPNVLRPCNLSD
jgi:hypothetical protein